MDVQTLTDAVHTLHARQEVDKPWWTEMYNTICQHADALDQLSQYVITNKQKTDGDILGVAVKAHSEVESLRAELTDNTKTTFHQVDAELDKMKASVNKVEQIVELMGSADIEGKFKELELAVARLKKLEAPIRELEGPLLQKTVTEHETKVEFQPSRKDYE